jgi:SAM-dependent methyltransferase
MRVCLACGAQHAVPDWTCPACGLKPPHHDGIVYFAQHLCGGDGTDAAYPHEALARAEDAHFWFRARAKLLVWAMGRHFPAATSLFDVGCGRGSILADLRRSFPAVAFAGGEALHEALLFARKRLPGADLYQIDARTLPFDREFDVVTSCDVLEHLDDDGAAARELFRVVRPGGGIMVTVPQHRWLWSANDTFSRHRRRYERRQLIRVLEQAGFVVERVTSFVTALLPLFMLSRVMPARRVPARLAAELRIGGMTNSLLEKALDLERWAIRSGWSFPIGSSLLIVGRRPYN